MPVISKNIQRSDANCGYGPILGNSTNLVQRFMKTRAASLFARMLFFWLVGGFLVFGEVTPSRIDYNFDIKPILSDRCYKCHGPDNSTRKAKLRLDLEDSAKGKLEGGRQVIKPGDFEKSELYRRITTMDPDDRMPPPESNLSLDPGEISLIAGWIEEGAQWRKHWSFIPLEPVPVPSVQTESWPVNAIDRFVLNRLEREHLEPSNAANKESLIRRLSFDLTGLPPSLDELDTFLADRSPRAFEMLVDRLVTKPAYGEQMAVEWLDLARYSDSFGYQVDRNRFVWPWRDWVIKAFNENMPYDQFVTWQLAGDFLPDATDEQILATTFNRLHSQKVEGGSTPEEFRVEYVADRTHTFGTAFLGLSIECSRCHDHKYDPFTQKEYYELFAFFNNIDEAGLYSYFTPAVPTPTLLLADPSTQARIDRSERRIEEAERNLADLRDQRETAFSEWLKEQCDDPEVTGRLVHYSFGALNSGKLVNGMDHEFPATSSDANQIVPGKIGKAIRLTGDDGVQMKFGNFRRYDPFSFVFWLNTPDVKERAVVFHRSRAWTDAGSRGYELLIEEGKLSAALIHFWPGNAIRIRTEKIVPTNTWMQVAVTYDGSSRANGLKIFIDGQRASSDITRDQLTKNITGGGGDFITIGERMRDRGFKGGMVDEFQVFGRELTSIEVAQLHDERTLGDLLSRSNSELTNRERENLFEYYLFTKDSQYETGLGALRTSRIARSEIMDPIQEIMVMRDLPSDSSRTSYVLNRGAYDAPGERVTARTQAALPPFPEGLPQNRLGLAQWLTSPRHPLMARVTVNRIWQKLFGYGLVRTPEDFGSQGELPTHPKLLDWLAKQFIDSGWDLKSLIRTIVMSATYRQSSDIRPELITRDPQNRLLARAPRYRLSAEMIRDNALAVSGLLVKSVGGAPVKPYEVGVSFKPVSPDKGEGLYRRSLYTFWKRTGPAPVMMTLDASKRDVCAVRRERTSTPLQSLVLLNDPQFVEAARMLGQRMIRRHGNDSDGAIEEMFRLLTSRRISEDEKRILQRLFDDQLEHFKQHPGTSEQFLSNGASPNASHLGVDRLAAAGVLAGALMNFDECLRKH